MMRAALPPCAARAGIRVVLALAASGLCACAPLRVPPVSAAHPASSTGAAGAVAEVPAVLDPSRATPRNPAARSGTMLHTHMPMHGAEPHEAHSGQ